MVDRKTNQVVASVIPRADQAALKGFVYRHANLPSGAKVYTDEHPAYVGLPNHGRVKHHRKQYVKGECHTNSIESFWAMLRR
jgi:IS1 family transposase